MGIHSVRKGFTLIELLVVIAIIAILAAILFPMLASAKQSAIKARCIQNEKQILHGIAMYTQDNLSRVPPGYSADTASAGKYNWGTAVFGVSWNERILRYVPSKAVFVCPAVPKLLLDPEQRYFVTGSGGWITTYGYNWRLCSGGGDQAYPAKLGPQSKVAQLASAGLWGVTVSAGSVRAPSKTVMICEAQNMASLITKNRVINTIQGGGGMLVFDDDGAGNANWPFYWLIRWLGNPYAPQGHGLGAVFGMVDGHVQYVRGVQPNPSGGTYGTPPKDSSGFPLSSVRVAGLRWW